MTITVRGRVDGVRRVQNKLAAVRGAVPVALGREALGSFLLKRMKDRFLKEIDPDDRPWARLQKGSKRGEGILRQTRSLYDSIKVIRGVQDGGLAVSTGAGFRIGVVSNGDGDRSDPAFYGRFHQTGVRKTNLPKRQFLGVGARDVKAIADKVRRELAKAVK